MDFLLFKLTMTMSDNGDCKNQELLEMRIELRMKPKQQCIAHFSFVFGIKHCAWHQTVLSDNYMHRRLVSKYNAVIYLLSLCL